MLRWPFRYHHSFMYAAVSDVSYIVESTVSWEKESGLVAKLCPSDIRFGYCAIMTVTQKTRGTTSVCLHVPTFYYETQHNQRLYSIRPDIGIRLTMSKAMTINMHCPSIMISPRVVIMEAPSSKCRRGNVVNGVP